MFWIFIESMGELSSASVAIGIGGLAAGLIPMVWYWKQGSDYYRPAKLDATRAVTTDYVPDGHPASVTERSHTAARPGQEDLPDHLQDLRRHRIQERRHRARHHSRNRRSRQQNPEAPRFQVVKRRWGVERSLGWRDYEALPASSEAIIHVASIDNLAKRI